MSAERVRNSRVAKKTETLDVKPEQHQLPASDFYRAQFQYWKNYDASFDEGLGVWPLGGAGLTEVRYRCYEEWRHFRKIVPLSKESSVLEMGCGNGRWGISLAPLVGYYEGIDISARMLEVARRKARDLSLTNLIFREIPVQEYVPQRNFDIAYLGGVSQFLQDEELKKLLSRLKKNLSKIGIIVDRSTVQLRDREVSNADHGNGQPYISIYRTTAEIDELYASLGFNKRYQRETYVYLQLPTLIQNVLNGPRIANLAAGLSPVSFTVLRGAAQFYRVLRGRVGQNKDYSHDFFIFEAK
jgi:SAM-dependent methyltransferase